MASRGRVTKSQTSRAQKNKPKNCKGSAEHKFERRNYLRQLVHEFENSNSKEAKQQVLGNLANFSYDPYNVDFIKDLKIVELFLKEVQRNKLPEFVDFCMAGLCNCSADETLRSEIVRLGGSGIIIPTLQSRITTTVTSALTTLMHLASSMSLRPCILTADLRTTLEILLLHEDRRVVTLSKLFLTDYFGR